MVAHILQIIVVSCYRCHHQKGNHDDTKEKPPNWAEATLSFGLPGADFLNSAGEFVN